MIGSRLRGPDPEHPTSRCETSARFAAVRAVLRRHGKRIEAGEVAYRVYLAVMLVIVAVAPAVRWVTLWLAHAPQPSAVAAGALVPAALTVIAALLVLVGAHTGPARASLPQLDLLHVSPLPRARLLVAAGTRWFGSGAALGFVVGGVVAAAGMLRGDLTLISGIGWVLWGASCGLLLSAFPLVGQIGVRTRIAAASLLGIAAVPQVFTAAWSGFSGRSESGIAGPDRGVLDSLAGLAGLAEGASDPEWLIGRYAITEHPFTAAAGLLLTVIAVVTAFLIAAPCLRRDALREQAARRDIVYALAASGDPSAALVRLGAPVRMGRRLRLRATPRLTLSLVRRDLLGLVRAPGCSVAGLVALLAAGSLWGAALVASEQAGGGIAALFGAAAMLVCYLALSAWCRGIATASAAADAPSLLPASPRGLIARHLVVPGALGAIVFGSAAVTCAAAITGAGASAQALVGSVAVSAGEHGALTPAATDPISSVAVTVILVSAVYAVAASLLLRVIASLKGPIPLRLLAPVTTPVGDMAGINVLLWTLDGPIVALLIGAVLGALWGFGIAAVPLLPFLVSGLLLAGLLLWANARLPR
ncbi:MAG: hypothetical protein ACK5LO_00745 [Leucobacter sp.]